MTITTVGSGMGATWAMVEESAYGVVKTSPSWTFYEPTSIKAQKQKNTKQSSGMAGGRLVDVTSRRAVVSRSGTASIPLDWCTSGGYSKLLNQLSSSYATGAAGAQTANTGIYSAGARVQPSGSIYGYTHTFRNSIAGRSASMQFGTPTADGVLQQQDALGGKPTKFQWDLKAGDLLTCATDWDFRVLEDPLITTSYEAVHGGTVQTPYTQAAPSYTVQAPFAFPHSQIQIGASVTAASNATPIDGVTGMSVSVENKLNTGRQYHGNGGLKDEPIRNGVVAITGTITSDYLDKTYFADRFYSDAGFSLIWTLAVGALGGSVAAMQFVLNGLFLTGDTPSAENMDIVTGGFPFVALYDLSVEPLTVIIQTTDATG